MNATGSGDNHNESTYTDRRDYEERRGGEGIPLHIIKTDQALTEDELKDLKKLAADYRAAKFGIVALVSLGALILSVVQVWEHLVKVKP